MPKLGQHCTPETIAKISLSKKGKLLSSEHYAKVVAANKARMTPEVRAKISLSTRGTNNHYFGKHHTPETIAKISLAKKGSNHPNFLGKHHTPEARAKISMALSGSNNHFFGKHHSPEARAKLSLALSGSNNPNFGKHRPPEMRAKLSLANRGSNNPNFGKHHSEERKAKLSYMGKHPTPDAIAKMKIARSKQVFPVKDTSIEVKIQDYLKALEIDFEAHYYMNIEHAYLCDIYIPVWNMVIECDGDYWHCYPVGKEIDRLRTKELTEKGYTVLRLWEHEIKEMTVEDLKQKFASYPSKSLVQN